MPTLYEILELDPNATELQIKHAFYTHITRLKNLKHEKALAELAELEEMYEEFLNDDQPSVPKKHHSDALIPIENIGEASSKDSTETRETLILKPSSHKEEMLFFIELTKKQTFEVPHDENAEFIPRPGLASIPSVKETLEAVQDLNQQLRLQRILPVVAVPGMRDNRSVIQLTIPPNTTPIQQQTILQQALLYGLNLSPAFNKKAKKEKEDQTLDPKKSTIPNPGMGPKKPTDL